MSLRWFILVGVAMGCAAPTTVVRASKKAEVAARFDEAVKPILAQFCYECHNEKVAKGDLNLAQFDNGLKAIEAADVFREAKARVYSFEMPPEGKPQLNDDQRVKLERWFESIPKDKPDCNEIATDRTQRFYQGYVMSRRLNRLEYGRSVRDLLGVDLKLEADLPADGSGDEGFDTSGAALFSSPILIEKYLDAADRAARAVLPATAGPHAPAVEAARKRLLGDSGAGGRPPRESARTVLAGLARRAYRRPVMEPEVERLLAMYDRAAARGDSHEAALRLAVRAVLVSPSFLFLVEPEAAAEGVHPLPAHPLAARLAYFLWSSLPDEELSSLADSGKLLDTEVLRAQVRRMLKDPRSRALGEGFALQWLALEPLGTTVRPDAGRFPEFDDALLGAMREEAAALFHHVMAENRPLTELLDSDYTFVNRRLAAHYGLTLKDPPRGDTLERVVLQDRSRGGVLGLGAVHAVTSFPLRTSPVLRGRWLLEELLGSKVPPPPPNVPSLEEEKPGQAGLTLRQRLEKHRSQADCAACHARMDPLGFGLENFDVVGRFRKDIAGAPIDASGTLPSGEKFNGPVELKAVLLRRKPEVLRHLTRKMYGYAMGREVNRFDQCVIEDAMKNLARDGDRSWSLIETIVLSYPYRHRYTKK